MLPRMNQISKDQFFNQQSLNHKKCTISLISFIEHNLQYEEDEKQFQNNVNVTIKICNLFIFKEILIHLPYSLIHHFYYNPRFVIIAQFTQHLTLDLRFSKASRSGLTLDNGCIRDVLIINIFQPLQQLGRPLLIISIKYNHHQPSLAKKIFFSSSFTSLEKSLMATEEHFLFLVTFPFLSCLHIPSHSPKVSPASIQQTGTLFCWASPLTIFTQLASVQFLARTTYFALTFSSLLQSALATSWIPLARRESELEVWMILFKEVQKSIGCISVVIYQIQYLLNIYQNIYFQYSLGDEDSISVMMKWRYIIIISNTLPSFWALARCIYSLQFFSPSYTYKID